MTTTDDTITVPTMPACGSWCPGHHDADADVARWPNGRWAQTCSAPSFPDLHGHDPQTWEHVQVGWGADTFANDAEDENWSRSYSISLDVEGQQDLGPDEARLLASYLMRAADDMEAAMAADGPRGRLR